MKVRIVTLSCKYCAGSPAPATTETLADFMARLAWEGLETIVDRTCPSCERGLQVYIEFKPEY
jgi:hypothetical protein